MDIEWIDGFSISVRCDNGAAVISANRAGLLSLAGQLMELAKGEPGDHIHYDENNSLEEGSTEIIVERMP